MNKNLDKQSTKKKKNENKLVWLLILAAVVIYFALKFWAVTLAVVVAAGLISFFLYFRNPSFRAWILGKFGRGKTPRPQDPAPPTRGDGSNNKNKGVRPFITRTKIIATADPSRLTDQQVYDEAIKRGLGK